MPDALGRLRAEGATIGYDKRVISDRISVSIPDESFTVIVGPNACGKSTLLRGLSRLLKPSTGQIVLDGALHNESDCCRRPRSRRTEFG